MSSISQHVLCGTVLVMKAEGEPDDRLPHFPYLLGGLLPRPPPEGLPVWLGAFSSCANMMLLLVVPRNFDVRGPGAYLAYVWWNRFSGIGGGCRSHRNPLKWRRHSSATKGSNVRRGSSDVQDRSSGLSSIFLIASLKSSTSIFRHGTGANSFSPISSTRSMRYFIP